MAKASQAQMKAVRKWQENHYERLNLQLKKGKRDEWRGYAESLGMSLNAFAVKAIEEKIERLERGES